MKQGRTSGLILKGTAQSVVEMIYALVVALKQTIR
jgi:hypothetical protein